MFSSKCQWIAPIMFVPYSLNSKDNIVEWRYSGGWCVKSECTWHDIQFLTYITASNSFSANNTWVFGVNPKVWVLVYGSASAMMSFLVPLFLTDIEVKLCHKIFDTMFVWQNCTKSDLPFSRLMLLHLCLSESM